MQVWISKYALTTGIYIAEVEYVGVGKDIVRQENQGTYGSFYYPREWHLTEDSAKARANEMLAAKIKSLKAQLAKYEKMTF